MPCTKWTTILVNSQTRKLINSSNSQIHQLAAQHARRLVNSSTQHVVNFSAHILTLWVPFLSTTCSPCRKKSILAEVCFDAKGGEFVNVVKWIFISRNRHLYHISGYLLLNIVQFAAKRSAICRKTQCILVLNAVRFGAKCSAKWC